ncbi:hypothetical protein HAX54_015368 [Datura stramonium]|uniref:Uncharacterized protein n=1 Tax=Datura stramonium TaxID=4076 RepID=A0ABS8RZF4_DATST|nr:hypothetical protein [Datura stramonium]
MVVIEEPLGEPGAIAKRSKGKSVEEASSKDKRNVGKDLVLELQNENALLKAENTALKKQLEDLTQQMLCDQHAANKRLSNLLSEL